MPNDDTETAKRKQLHSVLCDILGSDYVYFQPPETVKMHYPCFVYERSGDNNILADNIPYLKYIEYEVEYVSQKPDSDIFTKIFSRFNWIRYARHYVADNLHHDVFYVNY